MMTSKSFHLVLTAWILGSGAWAAQPAKPTNPKQEHPVEVARGETPAPAPAEEPNMLFWNGTREGWSNSGLDLALVYKFEVNQVLSGGTNPGFSQLGNLDFKVGLDFEELIGWKGGSLFTYLLVDHGGKPSLRIGDKQVTSNLEVPGVDP